MKLRTATLLALMGVSIQFLSSLAMSLRYMGNSAMPPLYRLAMIPPLLFYMGLIVFFVTLLKKQGVGTPANE